MAARLGSPLRIRPGARVVVDLLAPSAYTPAPMACLTRTILRPSAPTLLAAALFGIAAPLPGQGTGTGSAVRAGVAIGGISTFGLTLEYVHEHSALELTVGTWSFRDLSVSVVLKEYLGAGDLLPFVGGGLWIVLARPPGERTGVAAVFQVPGGVEWEAAEGSYVGATLNVNRALAVRRGNPQDRTPLNRRFVPLPGVYYRWKRS